MSNGWNLPTTPIDPGFDAWRRLDQALTEAQEVPGIYLVRSRHLGEHHWTATETQGVVRWRHPGVIYVGISFWLKDRLKAFEKAARDGKPGHPGGYWFHHRTRTLAQYGPVGEGWPGDLEVSLAEAASTCPSGVSELDPRWISALRASIEAVEGSIVADVMAHRVATGCAWRLLNNVDRSTYQER